MTARTRCGWAKLRECSELLYGKWFVLKQKWAVYKSYVRSDIPYWNEVSPLMKTRREFCKRSMVGVICGVQLKD